jgi:hypothetical protein
MMKNNYKLGQCPACAYKIYKPEQRFRILQKYKQKSYLVEDIRLENRGGRTLEIYTLKNDKERIRIYFDIDDLFKLW